MEKVLGLTRDGISYNIKQLKDNGVIERIGATEVEYLDKKLIDKITETTTYYSIIEMKDYYDDYFFLMKLRKDINLEIFKQALDNTLRKREAFDYYNDYKQITFRHENFLSQKLRHKFFSPKFVLFLTLYEILQKNSLA